MTTAWSPAATTTLDADSAKEAVSGVNRQDAEAAKVSAAASAEPANEIHASAEGEIAAPPPQSCPPTALTRRERGLRKRTSGSCRGRKLKQPSAPIRHPQGKRRPAAMRRRSEMINQQSPSAREWPLRHPNQARLPLHRQQRLRLRSSGCTSLASLCLLDERSGNVCLSGAADRRVRSQERSPTSSVSLSQVGQYGHTRLDYRRLRLRLPVSQHPVASWRPWCSCSAFPRSVDVRPKACQQLTSSGGRALPARETGTNSKSACGDLGVGLGMSWCGLILKGDGSLVQASWMAWKGVRHRSALRCLAKL